MLVSDYNKHVIETDQFKDKSAQERREISLYGLVGEIGSLVSAIKKQLIGEAGKQNWNIPNDEIKEELGDVVWYCFSLSQALSRKSINLFQYSIWTLKNEISAGDERAEIIHDALADFDKFKKSNFLNKAEAFRTQKDLTLDDYQKLAYLTARTDGQVLLKVCIAVLIQLAAELMRTTLPDIERTLNTLISHRRESLVLAEVAWHVAAIASLYELSLNDIAKENIDKANFRKEKGKLTPFHDTKAPKSEQFPRKFEISFVSVGSDRARMYFQGKQLGDELTDNAYEDDGYRFHDVMHLANVAHLGWSPVLRSLMKRKRKYDQEIDEVEDGARAGIVEELVIKAAHAEGKRLSQMRTEQPRRLFPNKDQVTFKLVKTVRSFAAGHEVEKNQAREWKAAIYEGMRVFYELSKEGQGTVTIDMKARSLNFCPHVCINLRGSVYGIGTASIELPLGNDLAEYSDILCAHEIGSCSNPAEVISKAHRIVAKRAIIESLGFHQPKHSEFQQLQLTFLDATSVSVKTDGKVRERMWENQVVSYKVSFADTRDTLSCTALAMVDPNDSVS